MTKNINQIIRDYAHDYRDMSMSEVALAKMLKNFAKETANATIEAMLVEEEANANVSEYYSGFNQCCALQKEKAEKIICLLKK